MAELKTRAHKASVVSFLNEIEDKQKRADCLTLLKIFEKASNEKAVIWGDSIVGFGSYYYKSNRSSQEGDWMLTGFSPRKQQISLYIMSSFDGYEELLSILGKHKRSKGCCLYIKYLADINTNVLEQIIRQSCEQVKANNSISHTSR